MTFHSILYERGQGSPIGDILEAPGFFADLNLDQVIDAIVARRQEYNLKPLFYASLQDGDAVRYRHEVLQDLGNEAVLKAVRSFAESMHAMRQHLAQAEKLRSRYQKERWFLDAVETYCDAVGGLFGDLSLVDLKSRGFLALRDYLADYARSDAFNSLLMETRGLKAGLAAIRYCLAIKGNRITVLKYEDEPDYGAEVEKTFERFKQGAVKDYRAQFPTFADMNHVEATILELVAQLFPDTFLELDQYCARNANYLDETIAAFDREVQFYIAYLEHIAPLERAGLAFCYPEVTNTSKEVYDRQGFDLALAHKLIREGQPIVCNDFHLAGAERVLVVSGPNQGGKTTFARTFGQLHYLASIGCPVPGKEARLFLPDRIFTHFERQEDIRDLRGKLQDDLVRIRSILELATPNSILIMNEIFTSTTLEDAVFLSRKVMDRVMRLDLLCVWVTFIDELSRLSEKTVSMVSTVDPENPALRTYQIVRRPADGLVYAMSIAEKYGLTYDRLKERIRP